METLITNGIRISVRPQYQPTHSRAVAHQYVFSYHIVIENCGSHRVQLLQRHWLITDGVGFSEEVSGEGVIGQQPILDPGDVHAYDSWCPLRTPLGHMEGEYTFINLDTNTHFKAQIPRFQLEAWEALN